MIMCLTSCTTTNRQRIERMSAVIRGNAGRQYGRELDAWLPYWERSFVHDETARGSATTANQWRLQRLAALLRSRAFQHLLDGVLPQYEYCRRHQISYYWHCWHLHR
jgi:hypothetical protein